MVLTGPRQSGKTTLLRHRLEKTHRYVSLETPDVRAAAAADPRGFLAYYPPPVIFDEIQHAPDLLPYIKERIDARRSDRGQYVLTGSQNLLMLERVTESLAGRAAMLRLMPLFRTDRAGARRLPGLHPHQGDGKTGRVGDRETGGAGDGETAPTPGSTDPGGGSC